MSSAALQCVTRLTHYPTTASPRHPLPWPSEEGVTVVISCLAGGTLHLTLPHLTTPYSDRCRRATPSSSAAPQARSRCCSRSFRRAPRCRQTMRQTRSPRRRRGRGQRLRLRRPRQGHRPPQRRRRQRPRRRRTATERQRRPHREALHLPQVCALERCTGGDTGQQPTAKAQVLLLPSTPTANPAFRPKHLTSCDSLPVCCAQTPSRRCCPRHRVPSSSPPCTEYCCVPPPPSLPSNPSTSNSVTD